MMQMKLQMQADHADNFAIQQRQMVAHVRVAQVGVKAHAKRVVVNGSRAHLPQARARYQSALLPVCLQVSPEILRQRLENRGRENASEINARLARAARYTPQDCHTLNNDGSLRQSVDTLLTLIHQKEKHHACL